MWKTYFHGISTLSNSHGGVELVALRGERMLDRVALDQALAADDGDAVAGLPGRRRR